MYVMNPEEVPSRPSWEIGKHAGRATAGPAAQVEGPLSAESGLHAQLLRHLPGLRGDGIADPLSAGRPPGVGRPQPGGRRGIDPRGRAAPAADRRLHRLRRLLSRHAPHADATCWTRRSAWSPRWTSPTTRCTATACRSREELRRQGIEPREAEMLSQARIFGVAARPDRRHGLLLSRRADRPVERPQGPDGRLPGLLPLRLYRRPLGQAGRGGLQPADPGQRGAPAELVRPDAQPAVEQVRLVHRRQPLAGHQAAYGPGAGVVSFRRPRPGPCRAWWPPKTPCAATIACGSSIASGSKA